MTNHHLIVYADLNCPFCYALHERLLSLGRLAEVEWRSIEHSPSVTYDVNDLHAQSELLQEVTQLRATAPEVNIIIPPARPNSHLASAMIVEACKIDPESANNFRTLVYRALWREGLDISNRKLLEELLVKAGLPELSITKATEHCLQSWNNEWENGEFSRNTPSLVTSEGNKLLGLPNIKFLKAFFTDSLTQDLEDGAFCYIKPKEIILIASDNEDSIAQLTNALNTMYQVEITQSVQWIVDSCQDIQSPDMVLLDSDLTNADTYEICTTLKDNPKTQNISIVLFSTSEDPKYEVKAFDVGANDFFALPRPPEVIKARIRVLLRNKRVTDLLEQFSRLDSLTEIPNRREFDRLLEKEWMNARRIHAPLSLILLDVDFFKRYNDNYGHLDGDQCLKELAQIIEKSIRRPHDTVARYGDEEFVVILPNTDINGAIKVAEQIQNNLKSEPITHEFSDVENHITVSQGISSITPHGKFNPLNLLDAADNALYSAKENGRNCYSIKTL